VSLDRVRVGFLPLVDAALPIVAREQGFAEAEGIDLVPVRDLSWATVRDRLLYGRTDAAHLLAPLAIATALGRGRPAVPIAVPFVLGLNGNAITLSPALADVVSPGAGLGEPHAVGTALAAVARARLAEGRPLRLGVVHRYSSHNYMLRYWLAACGARSDAGVETVTVSPPFAAEALAAGEVDGICVGEPWNSVAVDRGAGRIVLVTAQIWRRGVEKVLAARTERLTDAPELFHRLIRALHAAAAHFVRAGTIEGTAATLARPDYLDGSAELIRRAISDRIRLAQGEPPLHFPDFMFQYREAANFPWRSQAAWLYSQLVRWEGLPYSADAARVAEGVFRPDVYRAALAGGPAPLPGANSKMEGALARETGVGSIQGRLMLGSDRFFDGRTFDPDHIPSYLASLDR